MALSGKIETSSRRLFLPHVTSLLGDTPIEKGADDPDSIQVGVLTWNMNEKLPSVADLGLVLREIAAKSSIVAICTQECKSVGLMMNAFQGQPAEWEGESHGQPGVVGFWQGWNRRIRRVT